MGNVGLVLVGVVLFVNGLSSLGLFSARSAAPLNFLVGTAQVVLPTLIMLQADGDPTVLNGAWPAYLFGFTYLWWGIIGVTGMDPTGFGWYSAFVAAFSCYQAATIVSTDPVLATMWLTWAILWGLFFLSLGLGLTGSARFSLGRFAGWALVLLGLPSCAVTGIALLNDAWSTDASAGIAALGALIVLTVLAALLSIGRNESVAAPAAAT